MNAQPEEPSVQRSANSLGVIQISSPGFPLLSQMAGGPVVVQMGKANHLGNGAAVTHTVPSGVGHGGKASSLQGGLEDLRVLALVLDVVGLAAVQKAFGIFLQLTVHFFGVAATGFLGTPVPETPQLFHVRPAGSHLNGGHDAHAGPVHLGTDVLDVLGQGKEKQ